MKYIIYLLSSAVVVSSAIVVFNTVVKKEVVENNNVEVNEQNYVYDKGNGLVWLKCDYGLAGKDCDIPNDCGFDGTRQGANDIKLEDAPACSPEWDYGATIRVKNTPVLSNYRYVDSDDSGVAVCSNGVLCKDGAFIIAEALHEENYNYANDAQFVKVPNAEKDRACENHGGIATFGSEKIYNWELPTIDELETLNDEEEGINSKLFPNASKEFLSINQAVGDVPNPYQTVVFEPKKDIAIDDTDINAPVKCVFRVEPEFREQPMAEIKPVVEPIQETLKCEGLNQLILMDAINDNLVDVKINGTGLHTGRSINLEINNNTNSLLSINVPLGLILYNDDPAYQNMVVSREEIICLPPSTNLTLLLNANCVNSHRGSPSPFTSFKIGPIAPEKLLKVLRVTDNQGSIWEVTDRMYIDPLIRKIPNQLDDLVDYIKNILTIFAAAHICLYLVYDKFILKNPNPILNRIYTTSKNIVKIIWDACKKIINAIKTKK